MSATEGIHSQKLHKVDPNFDGLKYVLLRSFVPDLNTKQVTSSRMADELAKYDIPLVINQCEYHILRRLPETEGMLHCLPDLLVAGSRPVNWNLYAGARAAKDVPLQQLSDEGPRTDVECIEGDYKGEVDERERCCAQLQYVQGYGVNAFGWRLTDEEIQKIDSVSSEGKATALWQEG
ncbi:MAG: hypothetical protein Q9179_006547 [Wetmoreana sp. 5 TL-2023]